MLPAAPNPGGIQKSGEDVEQPAVGIENLDPVVIPVRHPDPALGVGAEAVGMLNSPGAFPGAPQVRSKAPSGENRWTAALP